MTSTASTMRVCGSPIIGDAARGVEPARVVLKDTRRPANAGRRQWEVPGGILRCAECGRAMSSRSYSKEIATGSYFYYCCSAGGYNNTHVCSARTHHKALPL